MKYLSDPQKQLLLAPLPDEAIAQHPTKSNLSTIKGIFVTDRLNEVFGAGMWSNTANLIGDIKESKRMVEAKGNKAAYERTEYMAVMKVVFEVKEYGIYYECIAGSSNDDPGDSAKGAITDCLTKISSWMGIGADVYKRVNNKPESKPQPEAKPVLSPTNKKLWDSNVFAIRNKRVTYENVLATYEMTAEDKEKLLSSGNKQNAKLKPGTEAWASSVKHLHGGGKIEDILYYWSLSDDDRQDLLIDATNYEPTNQTPNQTK